MLALCPMLFSSYYYAKSYAAIMWTSLVSIQLGSPPYQFIHGGNEVFVFSMQSRQASP